jgi:hypothetical protein
MRDFAALFIDSRSFVKARNHDRKFHIGNPLTDFSSDLIVKRSPPTGHARPPRRAQRVAGAGSALLLPTSPSGSVSAGTKREKMRRGDNKHLWA